MIQRKELKNIKSLDQKQRRSINNLMKHWDVNNSDRLSKTFQGRKFPSEKGVSLSNTSFQGFSGWNEFQLIQRIQNQKKEEPKITLLFKGSEHGMTAQAFWGKCSNQGPTIVICKSKNGYVFGGYSPCKWIPNVSAYQKDDSKTSFLFSYTRKEIYPVLIADHAIYCQSGANYGPTFGGGHILNIAADFQTGYSNMNGQYYSNESYKIENSGTHLMGDSTPQLVEMEVFLIE